MIRFDSSQLIYLYIYIYQVKPKPYLLKVKLNMNIFMSDFDLYISEIFFLLNEKIYDIIT